MDRDCVHSIESSDDSLHTSTLLLSTCSSKRRHRKRSEPRTLLRRAKLLLFILTVVFFLIGILLTTFGFSGLLPIPDPIQLTLRIIGPVCLAVDLVTCLVCGIVFRLWREEWKRRRQAVELRNRVLLHALAIDVMNESSTNELLKDPHIQRKILKQLRQETAAEISSTRSNSIKSSQTINVSRRQSGCSITVDALQPPPPPPPYPYPYPESAESSALDVRRRSSCQTLHHHPGIVCMQVVDRSSSILRLPGIQISRMETSLDLGGSDELLPPLGSVCRSVLIESDVSGDVYRISCTSEYSLSGCGASSYSSRLWEDLSSRESEWDADVSIGSRESSSQLSVARQDWSGGPAADFHRRTLLLPTSSASSRRHPTAVSTDTCQSTSARRHSSPTECCLKCKECSGRALAQPSYTAAEKPPNLLSVLKRKYQVPGQVRKYSSEDIQLSSTRTSPSVDHPVKEQQPVLLCHAPLPPPSSRVCRDCHRRNPDLKNLPRRFCVAKRSLGGSPPSHTLHCVRASLSADQSQTTDDSEVERRVNRLLYEIDHSLTDSVDESKIRSQEFEPMPTKVDTQTQTPM